MVDSPGHKSVDPRGLFKIGSESTSHVILSIRAQFPGEGQGPSVSFPLFPIVPPFDLNSKLTIPSTASADMSSPINSIVIVLTVPVHSPNPLGGIPPIISLFSSMTTIHSVPLLKSPWVLITVVALEQVTVSVAGTEKLYRKSGPSVPT